MVSYTDKTEGVTAEMLHGFFQGWPVKPNAQTHQALLGGSDHAVLALDGRKVVGFITAVTDGALSAYIPFLEVLPEYQNQGIGKELVRLLLLKLDDCYMIDLVCDPDLRPFYLSLGFTAHTAMVRRNPKAIEGANRRNSPD